MDPELERGRKLFLQHQYRLMDYILGLTRNAADAEDLFQEVSLVILEKAGPEDPSAYGAWCRGIARNKLKHHWRSKARSRVAFDSRLADLAELAFSEVEDEEGDEAFARRRALQGCLERLGGEHRTLLTARYVEGVEVDQLCARSRRAPGALRQLLHRVRGKLRRCIEFRLGEERLA